MILEFKAARDFHLCTALVRICASLDQSGKDWTDSRAAEVKDWEVQALERAGWIKRWRRTAERDRERGEWAITATVAGKAMAGLVKSLMTDIEKENGTCC